MQDNCRFHRYDSGHLAEYVLNLHGVRLVYLPPYSPELNPIESAFNVFKFHLRQSDCDGLLEKCFDAWGHVGERSARGFYRGCNYQNVPE